MSNQGKLPLLLFDNAISDPIGAGGWSKHANVTVTTGQSDPLGGTQAVLANDTVAGGYSESISSGNVMLTANANGEAVVVLCLKAGTATETDLLLRDGTAGVNRHLVNVAWSGGVPTLSTQLGSGTLFAPILIGNGWYLIRFSASGIVTGNSHNLFIYPAGTGSGVTGSVYVYLRAIVLMGLHLDNARSWPQPREGSEWVMAPSGVEDAWIVGTDYMLEGEVRWVPGLDVSSPHNRTGWDGRKEAVWVNVGWSSLLDYASGVTATVVFVPDRDDATTNKNVYIEEPREDLDRRPDLEEDTTRRFTLVLRDSDDLPFEGY